MNQQETDKEVVSSASVVSAEVGRTEASPVDMELSVDAGESAVADVSAAWDALGQVSHDAIQTDTDGPRDEPSSRGGGDGGDDQLHLHPTQRLGDVMTRTGDEDDLSQGRPSPQPLQQQHQQHPQQQPQQQHPPQQQQQPHQHEPKQQPSQQQQQPHQHQSKQKEPQSQQQEPQSQQQEPQSQQQQPQSQQQQPQSQSQQHKPQSQQQQPQSQQQEPQSQQQEPQSQSQQQEPQSQSQQQEPQSQQQESQSQQQEPQSQQQQPQSQQQQPQSQQQLQVPYVIRPSGRQTSNKYPSLQTPQPQPQRQQQQTQQQQEPRHYRARPQATWSGKGASITPDLTAELDREKAASAIEFQERMEKVSQGQDKSQISNTGTLCLALVLLLKEVIANQNEVRFFALTIALISASLCLQVIAGILVIAMHSLKSLSKGIDEGTRKVAIDSNKHSQELFQVTKDESALGSVRNTMYTPETLTGTSGVINEGFEEIILSENGIEDYSDTVKDAKDSYEFRVEYENARPNISPMTSAIFDDLRNAESRKSPWYRRCFSFSPEANDTALSYTEEEAVMRLYDIVTMTQVKSSMMYTEANISSQTRDKETDSGLESSWKLTKFINIQQQLLRCRLERFRQRRLFSRLSRVQQAITYLTYVVLVLNTLITGIYMSNTK